MARKFFTRQQYLDAGHTRGDLAWALKAGAITRGARAVYFEGGEPLGAFGKAVAQQLSSDGHLSSLVAAKQMGLDSVEIPDDGVPRLRRVPVAPELIKVNGIWCTTGLQVVVDVAALVDDPTFEQIVESALRKKRFALDELVDIVPLLSKSRTAGTPLIKRYLASRPPGAPPTESLLETLMVQLARKTEGVPEPTRQVVVNDEFGEFVARVDLAWPDEEAFNELDGEHHKDQPVYDAVRETNVVIATGWLPGRFSWTEVRWNPVPTGRRLALFIARARRRRDA